MGIAATTRAGNILDNLLNTTATATQKQRVVDAFALLAPPGATQTQIAQAFIDLLLRTVTDQIKFKEGGTASAATVAQVATDYTPLP